jgi:hypothetical protein
MATLLGLDGLRCYRAVTLLVSQEAYLAGSDLGVHVFRGRNHLSVSRRVLSREVEHEDDGRDEIDKMHRWKD